MGLFGRLQDALDRAPWSLREQRDRVCDDDLVDGLPHDSHVVAFEPFGGLDLLDRYRAVSLVGVEQVPARMVFGLIRSEGAVMEDPFHRVGPRRGDNDKRRQAGSHQTVHGDDLSLSRISKRS